VDSEAKKIWIKVLRINFARSEGQKRERVSTKKPRLPLFDVRKVDFFEILRVLKDMLKGTVVYRLYLNIKIGLENTACTAILTGSLWGWQYSPYVHIQ
jgi:hypothetical protein